jgi:hypothetical protein
MKKLFTIALVTLCYSAFSQQKDTITFMSLNVLNYPNGCGTNILNREDTLRKICEFVQPDIFVICELQEEFGADSILNKSLNVYGKTNYARANWVPNASSSNNFQNMLFYNTDKLTLQSQAEIVNSLRDINHYVLYVNDPYLGVHQDTIFLEVYMSHLKAGTGSVNENTRDAMAQLIRTYVDTRPSGRNHFLCGDLNVYDNLEPAYITLTSGGIDPFVDPINQAGDWHDEPLYASIHTQSPRTSALDCGAAGGMDDRFDQILVTQNVMDGTDSATYISGSYDALGNDGLHFDINLLDPPTNVAYPDSIVKAVYYMSDHLPIILDVEVSKAWDDLGLTATTTDLLCNDVHDGTALVTPTGGTANYSYQWDASAGSQTTALATNLSAGSYWCVVTDANGYVDSIQVAVTSPPALTYNLVTTADYGNCSGTANVTPSGGVPPYSFAWPINTTDLCLGDTSCIITDSNGCTDTAYVTIADSTNAIISDFNELLLVKVYPNPFENEVIIDPGKISGGILAIQLYDISGKSVLAQKFKVENTPKIKIPASNLPEGSYLLEIKYGERKLLIRMVK